MNDTKQLWEYFQEYLKYYGYLNKSIDPSELEWVDLKDGVEKFQEFMNLPRTGRIDAKTIEAMQAPRCGVPDRTTYNPAGPVTGDNTNERFVLQGVFSLFTRPLMSAPVAG